MVRVTRVPRQTDATARVVMFELRWAQGRARSGTSECCRRVQCRGRSAVTSAKVSYRQADGLDFALMQLPSMDPCSG